MYASLAEVRERSRRSNPSDNRRTMFLSSRVSIYFTWLLANTRATANGVTYVFTAVGVTAAALLYLPAVWAPMAAFALYRLHVVLDVVDGELARFRGTCSPVGAYLDFVTHYFVYTTAAFGMGIHQYLTHGNVAAIVCGFAVAVGLMMNLASKDCWYRANYRDRGNVDGGDAMWGGNGITLAAVKMVSVNTVWFLYAATVMLESVGGRSAYGVWPSMVVLAVYAIALPLYATARIAVTLRFGRIPRRASWYR